MILALLLSLAALAMVAALVSVFAGLAAALLDRFGGALTASARARVLLVLAVAPLVVALTVVGVALAPSVGLGLDHCVAHIGHHVHLCFAHAPVELGLLPILIGSLLAVRAGERIVAAARLLHRGRRVAAALDGETGPGGAKVIEDDSSFAFVVGWLRPRVFVTRGLLAEARGEQLETVLAHEGAHRDRRDPLRRLVASLATALHLPFIGGYIERRLALANEMAADECAAEAVGDRTLVAELLVRHARSGARAPLGAMAFGMTGVAARVTALLDDRRRIDAPSVRVLTALVVASLGLAVFFAPRVHHVVEHALGFLH